MFDSEKKISNALKKLEITGRIKRWKNKFQRPEKVGNNTGYILTLEKQFEKNMEIT